jgi:hypothetical protein
MAYPCRTRENRVSGSWLGRVRRFAHGGVCLLVFFVVQACHQTSLWLANCYGRADFPGNRAAQVNWLSLSERIRWQWKDRIRETLYNQDRKYRMISFQVFLEVGRMPQWARALERVRQPLGSDTRIGSGAAIETSGDLRLVVTPA